MLGPRVRDELWPPPVRVRQQRLDVALLQWKRQARVVLYGRHAVRHEVAQPLVKQLLLSVRPPP